MRQHDQGPYWVADHLLIIVVFFGAGISIDGWIEFMLQMMGLVIIVISIHLWTVRCVYRRHICHRHLGR